MTNKKQQAILIDLTSNYQLEIRFGIVDENDGKFTTSTYYCPHAYTMLTVYAFKDSPIHPPRIVARNVDSIENAESFVASGKIIRKKMSAIADKYGKARNLGEYISRICEILKIEKVYFTQYVKGEFRSDNVFTEYSSVIGTIEYKMKLYCEEFGLNYAYEW